MKSTIGLFLITLAVCGCQNDAMEPVKMDTGHVVPSASGQCQDWIAGRVVQVQCPR